MADTYAPTPDASSRPPRVIDPDSVSSERTYCLLVHLSTLVLLITSIPVVVPLIMWLVKRDESPFVDDHGKEVVNFQISILLYGLICIPLIAACGVGFALLIGVWALSIIGMILGAVAANRGEFFRYPMTLRLVR